MQDQVIGDMDGLSGGQPYPPISVNDPRRKSSEFDYRGVSVTESIVASWRPGISKLIWCRTPLGTITVDGKYNFLFYVEFDGGQEEEARTKVRAAFDAHWFPEADPKPQTWRDREPLL